MQTLQYNNYSSSSSPNKKMTSCELDQEIKIQIYFGGLCTVVYYKEEDQFEMAKFTDKIRHVCRFDQEQELTLKWVDEEGDPCTLSSQLELDEVVRLYHLNKERELVLHVFANVPDKPGRECAGEDRSLYRRGARRWRKIYLVNGHKYQAKRFARTALCKVCQERIWGLGRQGYKCLECKVMVHKRCHKHISWQCSQTDNTTQPTQPTQPTHTTTTITNSKTFSSSMPIRSSLKSSKSDSHLSPLSNNTIPMSYHELQVNDKTNEIQKTPKKEMSVEDFELIKVIGRGSYAKVFLAAYRRTQRLYAMKVIKKSMVNDDEDIDWVQTEKHVFEVATNHPFLVGLHSCFQTESRLFFVIEYLSGGDLMYHMQRQRKLPEEHCRFYSAEIVLALDFLHAKGIIYRDLKLDNVLLDAEGHVKLTDYGMCKEGLAEGERTSTFCGTPNYIAPEMLRGESYTMSVDWWALGVLCFEMMAGRSPFEVSENAAENPDLNTEDHLFQVILDKPIRIPRTLSPKATSLLKAYLQKQPADRLGHTNGIKDIQQHSFYSGLDWQQLELRLATPPFKPTQSTTSSDGRQHTLVNVDELFTQEEVAFTADSPAALACLQQNEFEGFEYVNPLILAEEEAV